MHEEQTRQSRDHHPCGSSSLVLRVVSWTTSYCSSCTFLSELQAQELPHPEKRKGNNQLRKKAGSLQRAQWLCRQDAFISLCTLQFRYKREPLLNTALVRILSLSLYFHLLYLFPACIKINWVHWHQLLWSLTNAIFISENSSSLFIALFCLTNCWCQPTL